MALERYKRPSLGDKIYGRISNEEIKKETKKLQKESKPKVKSKKK